MKLQHIALWTTRLEELKDFYETYFEGQAGEKYVNPHGFSSYFITFSGGASLELMQTSMVQARPYNAVGQFTGLTHIAFAVDSQSEVDDLTRKLQAHGYSLEKSPGFTGDGFYESAIFDPDENIVEITWIPNRK